MNAKNLSLVIFFVQMYSSHHFLMSTTTMKLHQIPHIYDLNVQVPSSQVDLWKEIHINTSGIVVIDEVNPAEFPLYTNKIVIVTKYLGGSQLTFIEDTRIHAKALVITIPIPSLFYDPIYELIPVAFANPSSINFTSEVKMIMLSLTQDLPLDGGSKNFMQTIMNGGAFNQIIDGNYSTCSTPLQYISVILPSTKMWVGKVTVCTTEQNVHLNVSFYSPNGPSCNYTGTSPAHVGCQIFSCYILRYNSHYTKLYVNSLNHYVHLCELEVTMLNMAIGTTVTAKINGSTVSIPYYRDLNIIVEKCITTNFKLGRDVFVQILMTRIDCSGSLCSGHFRFRAIMDKGEKNYCPSLTTKPNSLEWIVWPCFGITSHIILVNDLTTTRIISIEIYGSEVSTSTALLNLLPSTDCSIMGANSNIICGQFSYWTSKSEDSAPNNYNPFLILDDSHTTCISSEIFKNFSWISILPGQYDLEKLVIITNSTPPLLTIPVNFTFCDDNGLVEVITENIKFGEGLYTCTFNLSLSIKPSSLNITIDEGYYGEFCEFQLYGSKISSSKNAISVSNFQMSLSNSYNCTSPGEKLEDFIWLPSSEYCYSIYGRVNGKPWVRVKFTYSYLIETVLISHMDNISSVDIGLVGTWRGVEYLTENEYPFKSQRRICATEINLNRFSERINCLENAYGNYLYVGSLNYKATIRICELGFFGYRFDYLENEHLLRMVDKVSTSSLIHFDGNSNVTSLSISPMFNGEGELIIYGLPRNYPIQFLNESNILLRLNEPFVKNNDILYDVQQSSIESLLFEGDFTAELFVRIFGIFKRGVYSKPIVNDAKLYQGTSKLFNTFQLCSSECLKDSNCWAYSWSKDSCKFSYSPKTSGQIIDFYKYYDQDQYQVRYEKTGSAIFSICVQNITNELNERCPN
ncbi:DgyrCDS12961 [Dimorphilus gyrociliatus]|uniref:DgyrCDS12961 n=1 Tax=Dimorphilus gyrociliatus TaxID=2664684 RepID=A0A7I8W983_9ANNE|nr:DgyrCDS12961 [Dimorphilus gyrociliatus]